jgi:glycolate oxidase FAD binding subunit
MAFTPSSAALSSNGGGPGGLPPAVCGVAVSGAFRPRSAAELGDLIRTAAAERRAVFPIGGGTHLGIGNPPRGPGWLVSTTQLDQIIAYEPADMTLSVQAGARIADVQGVLAANQQGLPIDVADPAHSTIGGLLASAMYGPRRLGWGALRDYLIGIEVAYPNGAIGKAGGMVVKNVSGFDLMRMHHGALGTLGVILSANFKVLPKPRSERTIVIPVDSVHRLALICETTLSARARPSAFELVYESEAVVAAARIEGRERTVALLAAELAALLGEVAQILDPEPSASFWHDYWKGFDARDRDDRWWLRSRVKPAETLAAGSRVASSLADLGITGVRMTASPGLGFLDLRGDSQEEAAELFDLVVRRVRSVAPRTTVVSAPPALRQGIDAWGDAIHGLDLMRRLKSEFDPGMILNPGRYVGGL